MTPPLAAPDALLAALGRACVQGGLFVLAVAALCRVFPRLPATLRFWLWWLACAKLLVSLFCGGLVPLPVPAMPALPAHFAVSFSSLHAAAARPLLSARSVTAPRAADAANTAAAATAHVASGANALAAESSDADAATATPNQPTATAAVSRRSFRPTAAWLLPLLFLIYVAGTAAALIRTLSGAATLRRLLRESIPVTDPALAEMAREIADRLGYDARRLRLRESARIGSPFVAGIVRPVLALPAGFLSSVNPTQARLALAHEIAHLRRGDLLLGAVPGMVRALFWFFPPAVAAARECAHLCEEICDAHAVALCPDPRAATEYGRLLLLLSAAGRAATLPNAAALGIAPSPGFARLKRRLGTLRDSGGILPLRPAVRRLALLLTALFGAAALPWRLTAFAALNRVSTAPLPTPPGQPAPPRFAVVDLGTLGGNYSEAVAISDDGRIVGAANTVTAARNGRGHAFVRDPITGTMTDLGASPFRRSVAVGVNRDGVVAGVAFNRATRPQLFLWNGGGKGQRRFPGTLPGFRYGQPAGIGDDSAVAGTALNGRDPVSGAVRARAFLYRDGRLRDLGTLGGPYSYASGITPTGIVVGKADLPRPEGSRLGPTHAFVALPGTSGLRDLGALPGGANSRAWGANRLGEVVGYSETDSDGTAHAFLAAGTNPSGGGGAMQDLGVLPGGDRSVAYAVSDRGWIVGAASVPDAEGENGSDGGATHAVLWVRAPGESGAGRLIDLNDLIPDGSGWTLEVARGINRHGWIVGQGLVHGKRRAFLLKPLISANG